MIQDPIAPRSAPRLKPAARLEYLIPLPTIEPDAGGLVLSEPADLLPEKPGPAASPALLQPRLAIQTVEHRYLLRDPEAFERRLRQHGAPVEYVPGQSESQITTVYLD